MESKFRGRPDRRAATRFAVSLRVEVWRELDSRRVSRLFLTTRDISVRGFYLFEEARDIQVEVGNGLNFVMLFPRQLTEGFAELMHGLARCVRIEVLKENRRGLGMLIEHSRPVNGARRISNHFQSGSHYS
jgi:hypothetical protein